MRIECIICIIKPLIDLNNSQEMLKQQDQYITIRFTAFKLNFWANSSNRSNSTLAAESVGVSVSQSFDSRGTEHRTQYGPPPMSALCYK